MTAKLDVGSTRRIVQIGPTSRRLPSLGSVAADASTTYVVDGPTLHRVDAADGSDVTTFPTATVPNAVDLAAGSLAIATATGVEVRSV